MAGKPYKKFIENQNKIMKTWILPVDGTMFRVVLEKDTLDIWVNGTKVISKVPSESEMEAAPRYMLLTLLSLLTLLTLFTLSSLFINIICCSNCFSLLKQ